jgi:hypothetical protein
MGFEQQFPSAWVLTPMETRKHSNEYAREMIWHLSLEVKTELERERERNACESAHSNAWNWLRAIESPTKTIDLPLMESSAVLLSIRGSSHLFGFHLQCRYFWSGRPFIMQSWCSCMYLHVLFVYGGAWLSFTQLPFDRSQVPEFFLQCHEGSSQVLS